MDRIIYTAMAGAKQTMDRQAVINHNLANVSTSGFRAQLSAMRAVPVQGAGALDTRASVVASTPGSDLTAGAITHTGRDLDVAMKGNAWLAVLDDSGSEAYTRRGDLQVDSTGLVMTGDGRTVLGEGGPIIVPLGSRIFMGLDGTLSAIGEGENPDALVEVGRLKLVTPGNPAQALMRGDDGLFRLLPNAEGEAVTLSADEEARVIAGALEGSNVSAVESMVAMIDNSRRYDLQMKVIETASENAQRANSLLSLS